MVKTAVADANTIILLSKINSLDLACNIFNKIIIPSQVAEEIFIKNTPDTILIKEQFGKLFKEVETKSDIEIPLGKGERAAISCCIESKINIFLTDDERARRFAKGLNLEVFGVVSILLWNLSNKRINKSEFIRLINLLMTNNYQITPEAYSDIMNLIHEEK
jgi:predicted nucleic acid-binding protein